MELTVLAISGCPNAPVLEQRLAGLVAGRPGVHISRHVVGSGEDAARLGMHGSPTLLIDGIDPFPAPAAGPALACRLYPSDEGRLEGAPAVSALRQALAQGGLPD
ncbi:MAG: thioredoxin family protein [Streptosporangiaceae bacterium]